MISEDVGIQTLEERLNDFDPSIRDAAVREIGRRLDTGSLTAPEPKREVNLHFHTFFSFNANGWSPSRIAWEARKYGLTVAGIVDFDVLDGMDEFLSAGEILGLRTAVAMESRVFISEYSDQVMSSPNEPGIAYFMAAGCYELPPAGSRGQRILASMRDMARRRNVQVMEKVNNFLDIVRLDYESDVLPLAPSGNATERHLLAAYDAKARQVFEGGDALASFWADKLDISAEEAAALMPDTAKFHEKMRSKLMKFGGVGYVAPTPDAFPAIETTIEMMHDMRALPTATWLDGTNPGEADMPAMLDLLASKGVVAMNIIPDRNWNIKDPDEKRIKVENLALAVKAARDMDFPLCVGTEMNKPRLPFVDNFNAPELAPYVDDFIDGAYFFWGHTFLARNCGIGYAGDWAEAHFGSDRRAKNEFYLQAGRLAHPISSRSKIAVTDLRNASPAAVLRILAG